MCSMSTERDSPPAISDPFGFAPLTLQVYAEDMGVCGRGRVIEPAMVTPPFVPALSTEETHCQSRARAYALGLPMLASPPSI